MKRIADIIAQELAVEPTRVTAAVTLLDEAGAISEAAVDLALAPSDEEPLPDALRARVEADAASWMRARKHRKLPGRAAPPRRRPSIWEPSQRTTRSSRAR